MKLEFRKFATGIYKVYGDTFLGSIPRSGSIYIFLPEPFVPFDAPQLDEISEFIKKLNLEGVKKT